VGSLSRAADRQAALYLTQHIDRICKDGYKL
jgi:hypothetical protein